MHKEQGYIARQGWAAKTVSDPIVIMTPSQVTQREKYLSELTALAHEGAHVLEGLSWTPLFCTKGYINVPIKTVRRTWYGAKRVVDAVKREEAYAYPIIEDLEVQVYLHRIGYVERSREDRQLFVSLDLSRFQLSVLRTLHHRMMVLTQPSS